MKRSNWLFSLLFAAVMPALAAPPPAGPGLYETPMLHDQNQADVRGMMGVYNNRGEFIVNVETSGDWLISELHLFVNTDINLVPTKKDVVTLSKFPFKKEFIDSKTGEGEPVTGYPIVVGFNELDGFEFSWGEPWKNKRVIYVALHADLVRYTYAENDLGELIETEIRGDAWGFGDVAVPGSPTGTAFQYILTHPMRGHFIDSPVEGLGILSETVNCKTDESGGFDYFPGERAEITIGDLLLGYPLADHKISPLDIFEGSDTDDPRVINMARLLQSFDADASPKEGILITDDLEICLNVTMGELGLTGVDFADDAQTESVIQGTIAQCEGLLPLVSVSAEDAKANLDKALDSTMFRKNISRTPALTSSKSKLNIMGVWFPALRANNEPTIIEYFDENSALIRTAEEAKPVVVAYTDGVEETGNEDIFAAISRDDGNTFKRMNLSRAADRSSFTLANETEYFGQAKKPVFQVKGNNILVAWTSKFCKGGKPAYAIDPEDEYVYDDPYYKDDIFGVGGPQRSVDYTEQGFPEVGEVPYSCMWVARGTIVTQGMINSGGFWTDRTVGEIVWFKPERLTSGRRDANQAFMGGADGAGFAIAWQEDPEGLRPGDAAGPGPGWGGATTNHKTDIWYSYITMADFRKIDVNFVSGGDPEHEIDVTGRPKALVPMSLPVRLSDNDTVNTENLMVELGGDGYPLQDGDGNWTPIPNPDAVNDTADGTHAYGYEIEGLCESFYEFINYNDDLKKVCITADARLLDGDTGASRPNVFLQTYTKPDGTKSAWAIMAYEETKGAGIGPPDNDPEGGPYGDEPLPEEGKNAIYHSFDFQNPDLVSAGNIINLPERDADGNLMYLRDVSLDGDGNVVYGELRLDYLGEPQLAYENARRPRFILQGKAAAGASNAVLLALYKEGQEGKGRPSDIMMRRVVSDTPGNPYAPANMVCSEWELADNGLTVCVDGTQNMSTVNPTVITDSQGDPTSDDPWGAVKVVEWEQTLELDLFANASWVNPYEDARAHRGAIRGDFVVMGYSYTPNWAAARNGNDKYDFYVRRSFDGGQTWTTDPAGSGVTHCDTFTDPLTKEKTEVCNTYAAGAFEQARNLSQLPNSKESVIEPRIVGAPGTIKVDGVWTGIAEDKQNKNVFYVSYGTATNPPVLHGDTEEVQEFPAPLDLYYSFSQDKGENFVEVAWDVNPDSDGNFAGETVYRWDFLAKGDGEQGEAQLRMTPDGSRFYATWLYDSEEGSDIWFRRVMSPAFEANVAATTTE